MQTTTQIMAAKKTDALKKLRLRIWQGADAEELAEIAMAGGIDAATVSRLEKEAAGARKHIEQVRSYNPKAAAKAVEKSGADLAKAKSAFVAAQAEFKKCTDAHRAAQGRRIRGGQLLSQICKKIGDGEYLEINLPQCVRSSLKEE